MLFCIYNNRNHTTLDVFLSAFEVLAYDTQAARVYGGIHAYLKVNGSQIGSTGMFIVAHAIANQLTLVTK